MKNQYVIFLKKLTNDAKNARIKHLSGGKECLFRINLNYLSRNQNKIILVNMMKKAGKMKKFR